MALLASDAQLDSRFEPSESILPQDIRSCMCAPLWHDTEVIGILYVDNPESSRFNAADLNLFTTLSNYAAVAIQHARLAARLLEERRQRERLQRYHSPRVIERILEGENETDTSLIAQERQISVLFADIVGFTTMSEQMTPPEVAQLLNQFFETMIDVIFAHEGTLDKFIGDAILATFGAALPTARPRGALRPGGPRYAEGPRRFQRQTRPTRITHADRDQQRMLLWSVI